jgi:hypothetical protein
MKSLIGGQVKSMNVSLPAPEPTPGRKDVSLSSGSIHHEVNKISEAFHSIDVALFWHFNRYRSSTIFMTTFSHRDCMDPTFCHRRCDLSNPKSARVWFLSL